MFKPRIKKKTDFDLKLKLNGKRLYPTNSVKYCGIKIDEKRQIFQFRSTQAIKAEERMEK